MLVFAVGFNLWLYRLEPTAKIDPNDNPFQYALVERTNQMWDYAASTCGINPLCFTGYLIDHWVPNWAQGYNLPYYYSHTPQIVIVASYRFLGQFMGMTLFAWYHLLIYLLLCLFPISVFLALVIIGIPFPIAGIGALMASQVSTDGLYGLDPSSFLWRGYGLTSQLFAMIWMPLAIALSFKFFHYQLFTKEHFLRLLPDHLYTGVTTFFISAFRANKTQRRADEIKNVVTPEFAQHRRTFWLAVLFVTLTISGHLGLGVMTLLSLGIIAISPTIMLVLQQSDLMNILTSAKNQILKLGLVSGLALFFLSYWAAPALINDKYHNLSFWDPVWKFNSWGWKEVMQHLLNGNLFDFGRFPVLTLLIFLGGFGAFWLHNKRQATSVKQQADTKLEALTPDALTLDAFPSYTSFSFLFLFWLLMFFGRATWGSLLDIIPSMKEFHQSRFIVGLHVSGFFLVPIGVMILQQMIERVTKKIPLIIAALSDSKVQKSTQQDHKPNTFALTTSYVLLATVLVLSVYPQTIRYSDFNDVLIKRGNENFDKQNPDVEKLLTVLKKSEPGRVFTGRGGGWGKKLQIAETTYFMHLSTYGIPVILWLPETWSPNSDIEQFFVEENHDHYDLMNIKYIVAPKDVSPQPFWALKDETPSWNLYTSTTSGYFGVGSHAAVIESSKLDYTNLIRLWLQSDYPKKKLFPTLTFDHKEMLSTSLPAFQMIDEATFKTRDEKTHGLFGETPIYEAPPANLSVVGPESSIADMQFKTTVTVQDPCTRCLVYLRQSFHPNWRAWVDGNRAETMISFPFYTAVNVSTPGTHTIEFKYEPSSLKMFLFSLASLVIFTLIFPWKRMVRRQK